MATVRLVRDGLDPVDVLPSQVIPFYCLDIFGDFCVQMYCDRM